MGGATATAFAPSGTSRMKMASRTFDPFLAIDALPRRVYEN
jgi:hypothetical protein